MLTGHVKPLFHEKTLAKAMAGFAFPSDMNARRAVVARWITSLERGTLDVINEISLHGEFLRDIFGEVLGYRSVIQGEGEAWTLHAEAHISDGGGSADGALGFFTATESASKASRLKGRIVAPIELKGAVNNLDRPASGRTESAVEQGWRYANYTEGCKWVLVSNYREIRLYRTSKTPAFYERFKLADLADEAVFRRFYFLLCAENFLPLEAMPDGDSRVDALLRESDNAEEAITKALYAEYKATRLKLVQFLTEQTDGDKAAMIETAQKILDRVLFIAFCEDRGLLPPNTIKTAHDYKDPYNPSAVWTRYKAVFRWVDKGNDNPPIPGYNGGLFKPDPVIDEQISLPDELCDELNAITRYDFDTDVSVEVLGHIFEQSVTDLEELKAAASGEDFDKKKGRRKTQGVYYTPAMVTQYIVDVALGGYLRRKEEELRQRIGLDIIPEVHGRKLAKAEREFWEAYRDEVLKRTRVLDPACGSGAFLIAAFDYLLAQYERVNDALAAFEGGQRSLFDLNKTILANNLYGVDLSKESVEITKLSLWLKTAQKGKPLTFLDHNIQQGDSIVDDLDYSENAFDWNRFRRELETRFKGVLDDGGTWDDGGSVDDDPMAEGGFDVVIGNPPYVRQELLSPIKPYLKEHYHSFDGVADLYTYFYERGVQVLKPGGVLSFIVTNKWLKSGYGEALRHFFAEHTVFEQILDFGHAPIFEDADVFPCIVSVRKPGQPIEEVKPKPEPSAPVVICPVPREKLADINLKQFVRQHGYKVPWSRFTEKAWSLEHPAVIDLMAKIKGNGIPLAKFINTNPCYGIKTGLNEAFLIDTPTRNDLLKEDPRSEEIVKPYLRGQDIKRWHPEWAGLWMIFARHGVEIDHYQAVKQHLLQFQERLEPRPTDWDAKKQGTWPGRKPGLYKWNEIQDPVDYWELFYKPKMVIQRIAFHSRISFDDNNVLINDAAIMIPKVDFWVLAVMNSPANWYYSFRYFPHKKDEALAMDIPYVKKLPIAPPTETIRTEAEERVAALIELTRANQSAQRDLIDWLKQIQSIDQPGLKLQDAAVLDFDAFMAEVKKRRPKTAGKLSVSGVKELREAYEDTVPAMQHRAAEAQQHERRLADLVNQAYGLTPEEIDLMWKTAPPRMPVGRE